MRVISFQNSETDAELFILVWWLCSSLLPPAFIYCSLWAWFTLTNAIKQTWLPDITDLLLQPSAVTSVKYSREPQTASLQKHTTSLGISHNWSCSESLEVNVFAHQSHLYGFKVRYFRSITITAQHNRDGQIGWTQTVWKLNWSIVSESSEKTPEIRETRAAANRKSFFTCFIS